MELKDLKAEIAKLEVEIATVPEADKPIIQDEINRLKLEAEKMETSLVVQDEELLNAARQATGEANRLKFPQAKTITVNNHTEEKEINGQKVTPRPDKTFKITEKKDDSEEYIDIPLGEEIEGVILKVRYQIFSKYKVDPKYRSFEFGDTRKDLVRIFTGTFKNPQITFQGSYAQAKAEFATEEKDSMGNFKKSFDLYALVYMDIDGMAYKFRTKLTMGNGLFDYLGQFGQGDTYLAYKTKLSLEWKEVTGSVKFWEVKYAKGERVDLAHYLEVLKELNKYFDIIDGKVKAQQTDEAPPLLDGPSGGDYSQPEPDDIKIEDIPF